MQTNFRLGFLLFSHVGYAAIFLDSFFVVRLCNLLDFGDTIRQRFTEIFSLSFDRDRLADYLQICTALRRQGIAVELFPEPKKLGQQLKYADRQGFAFALIAGTQEFEGQRCQVKDLVSGQSHDLPLDQDCGTLAEWIRNHGVGENTATPA